METRGFWFGAPGHEAFAVLHASAGPADTGLVICSAFGREELTVHRTLRHIAQGAAARGLPALRFDYPCTGDSAGDEMAAGQVALWIAAIGQAIDVLRRQTGVRRVHVLGFRIGALLALQAVAGRGDVAGLVSFAAPASGRAFLRELRMAGARLERADGAVDDGVLESGGYAMPADLQRELSALAGLPGALPAGCPVLAIERDDRPREAAWLAQIEAAGHTVTRVPLAGYAGMMAPSFRGEVPQAALDALFAWLDARGAGAPAGASTAGPPAPEAGAVEIHEQLLTGHAGARVCERLVHIDAEVRLAGVLSEPADPDPAAPAGSVLLLPPGADRRLGPGRLFVTLARELAARGQRVLRLDISGVGDSPARPGCAENAVYQPAALEDVALACGFLQKSTNSAPLQVVGHCSGAYNAFKGELARPMAASVTLINPLVFFWKPGMALEDPLGQTNLAAAALNYRTHAFSLAHWDRMVREPRRLLHVLKVLLLWPSARLRSGLRELARACGVRLEEDLGRELRALAQAGVRLNFFFSTGDPGETLLRLQGGKVVASLQKEGKLSVTRITGADHDLSHRRDRSLLQQQLTALLAPPSR